MADSLFDIFGDHLTRQAIKNVARQPLSNIENMGKSVSTGPIKNVATGPIKPNEPVKKGVEPKKSFLANSGKALQSTPARQAFTPRAINVGSLIYSDATEDKTSYCKEELEFTKPSYKYDNYHKDLLDYLPVPEPCIPEEPVIKTPPPSIRRHSIDFNYSYEDEFFTDDFSTDSIPEDELGLPELY